MPVHPLYTASTSSLSKYLLERLPWGNECTVDKRKQTLKWRWFSIQYVSPDNANLSAGSISQDSRRHSNSNPQTSRHPLELTYTSLLLPWSSLLFFPNTAARCQHIQRHLIRKKQTLTHKSQQVPSTTFRTLNASFRCHLHSYPHPTWATCVVKPATKFLQLFFINTAQEKNSSCKEDHIQCSAKFLCLKSVFTNVYLYDRNGYLLSTRTML